MGGAPGPLTPPDAEPGDRGNTGAQERLPRGDDRCWVLKDEDEFAELIRKEECAEKEQRLQRPWDVKRDPPCWGT